MRDHWVVGTCKSGLRTLFQLLYRIQYVGLENIPAGGPALVVPNHQSYLDPMLVGAALPRSVRYMATKSLFTARPVASFLSFFGAFPVATGMSDKNAVRTAIRVLRAGELLMIFPEGGRTRDGTLIDFFPGFARLAVHQNAPIVPVTISGAWEAWPPSRRFPRLSGRVRVVFHPPVEPGALHADRDGLSDAIISRTREAIRSGLIAGEMESGGS